MVDYVFGHLRRYRYLVKAWFSQVQKFILCVKTVSSQAQTKGSEFVLLRDQPFDLVVHGGRGCVCWGVQGEGG